MGTMKVATTVIAAVMTIAVGAAAQQRASETETVNRTVALPSGGTLKLSNFAGDVKITAASGRDVVIKAVRRATRERLDGIKLDIRTEGSAVVVDANQKDRSWTDRDNNVVETDFEIQVPASAKLDVKVFSSDITVVGVTGDQRLETFSGDIDVDATAAGASPKLSAETFSGAIRARLADSVKGDVSFDSFSGDFDSEIALNMRVSGNRRSRVTMPSTRGGGDSALTFKTFSGNVNVRK